MAEWFKAHAWKACERAIVPEVRILSLPPNKKTIESFFVWFQRRVPRGELLLLNKNDIKRQNIFAFFVRKREKCEFCK